MSDDQNRIGVIFDMDGLLLNTEVLYTQATQAVVARFGKTFDWTIKAGMIGRPAMDSARYLVETLRLPIAPEDYLSLRANTLRNLFPQCTALPGAERLVRHLHAHRVPKALASSSDHRLYELKTTRHRDWFELFDAVVLGDDPEVERGKPAPDIFLTAARRLRLQPSHCLVFEDAPSGLQAALSAGMKTIAVPDPHMDKAAFEQADQILDSLLDFAPQRWGLPAFA